MSNTTQPTTIPQHGNSIWTEVRLTVGSLASMVRSFAAGGEKTGQGFEKVADLGLNELTILEEEQGIRHDRIRKEREEQAALLASA